MLKWLYENRVEGCTQLATEHAVLRQNSKKLLWLKEMGVEVVSMRTAFLAFRRHAVEIFWWLRANYPEHVTEHATTENPRIRAPVSSTWRSFFELEASPGVE